MSSLDTILKRRLGQANKQLHPLFQEIVNPLMGPFAAGPGGTCICSNCKHEESHKRGESCLSTTCSKCGSRMVRKEVSRLSNRKLKY